MTIRIHCTSNKPKTPSTPCRFSPLISRQYRDWLLAQTSAESGDDNRSSYSHYDYSSNQPELTTSHVFEHLEGAVAAISGYVPPDHILKLVLPILAFNRILLLTQRHYSAWLYCVPFRYEYQSPYSNDRSQSTLLVTPTGRPIWERNGRQIRKTGDLARLMRELESANPGLLTGVFPCADLETSRLPKTVVAKLVNETSRGLYQFPGTPYHELETEVSIAAEVEEATKAVVDDQPDLNPGDAQLVELTARISLLFDRCDSFSRLPPCRDLANSYSEFADCYGTLLTEVTNVLLPEVAAHQILPLALSWLVFERHLKRAHAFACDCQLVPPKTDTREQLFRLTGPLLGKALLRQLRAFDRVTGAMIAQSWEPYLVGETALSAQVLRQVLRIFDWEGNRDGRDMVVGISRGIEFAIATFPELNTHPVEIHQLKAVVLPLFGPPALTPTRTDLAF